MTRAKPGPRQILRQALFALLPRTLELRVLMRISARDWGSAMTAARARNAGPDELRSIDGSYYMEYQTLEDAYEAIYARRLVNKAICLRVEVPTKPFGSEEREDENWEYGTYGCGWRLKPAGVKKVRAEIRAERRARTEQLVQWATLLIGVIGAATGLIAVILR